MSFTAGNTNINNTVGGTTVILTGVAAGNFVAIHLKWEGATGINEPSISDGTSSFLKGTRRDQATNDMHGQMFYLLSSVATGSVTYTVTWPAGAGFNTIVGAVAFAIVGGSVSLDVQNVTGADTGTALSTGLVTTTGLDELIICAVDDYNGATTTSAWQVGGVALDAGCTTATYGKVFWKAYSAVQTNIQGTATNVAVGSPQWTGHIMAFKITQVNVSLAWYMA